MTLTDIINQNAKIHLNAFDEPFAKEVQNRLTALGCLDPPADGIFGQVSRLAIRKLAKIVNLAFDDVVDANFANILLNHTADDLFPLTLGNDFASRIIQYMQLKNYWFARIPNFLTIVYVEGTNEDGNLNNDAFNEFNDRRIVLAFEDGKPKILHNALATTEPGRFFTVHPTNPLGAARIAFGQFKAWSVGIHKAGTPSAHAALVQVAPLPVHRDLNQDGRRTGDAVDKGIFGINQHKGFNAPVTNIGRSSAGCLVSRLNSDHTAFMSLVKTELRYRDASHSYRFISTIIAGDDLKNKIG
ncbi:MAG: peptidoglycan-binding domain-containing protein [Acidobacteriota bacterium]